MSQSHLTHIWHTFSRRNLFWSPIQWYEKGWKQHTSGIKAYLGVNKSGHLKYTSCRPGKSHSWAIWAYALYSMVNGSRGFSALSEEKNIYHQWFTFAGKRCQCCAYPVRTGVHLQCILNAMASASMQYILKERNKESNKDTRWNLKGHAFSTCLIKIKMCLPKKNSLAVACRRKKRRRKYCKINKNIKQCVMS